jgi:hypothetical protein
MKRIGRVSCVAAAMFFAASSGVSAATLKMNVGLEYVESYNSLGDVVPLTVGTALQGDGSTKTTVNLGGGAVSHKFDMYLGFENMAADQDFRMVQIGKTVTGAVTAQEAGYEPYSYMVNPPKMPAGTGSDAPNATWDNQNFFNGYAFVVEERPGLSQTGAGNGTYGDYSAYLQLGEAAPFQVGSMTLGATGPGTFGFHFDANPGYLEVINANTNGLGVLANEEFPTYAARGDSVAFVGAPEPGALVLAITGVLGLIAYAWRKRKEGKL